MRTPGWLCAGWLVCTLAMPAAAEAQSPAAKSAPAPSEGSAQLLIDLYGPRATAEIQRLRVNLERNVFVVFDAGIGYIQCKPQTAPDAIYCEAQSAESLPTLAGVLTPGRLSRLHAAGYAEPGGAQNYSKTYPLGEYDDAAIAGEVIMLLHDAYGYNGAEQLAIKTEAGREP